MSTFKLIEFGKVVWEKVTTFLPKNNSNNVTVKDIIKIVI